MFLAARSDRHFGGATLIAVVRDAVIWTISVLLAAALMMESLPIMADRKAAVGKLVNPLVNLRDNISKSLL